VEFLYSVPDPSEGTHHDERVTIRNHSIIKANKIRITKHYYCLREKEKEKEKPLLNSRLQRKRPTPTSPAPPNALRTFSVRRKKNESSQPKWSIA
jgi:hypothetical protein